MKNHFSYKRIHCFIISITIFFVLYLYFLEQRTVFLAKNNISPIADPYSEANSIRAGEGYYEKGFFADFFLPDIHYGMRFTTEGSLGDYLNRKDYRKSLEIIPPKIYTHYPPLPDLLVGLYTKIYGKGNILCFRQFPININFILLLFSFILTVSCYGYIKTSLLYFIILIPPMTTNMSHGLHYQGYAMSLFIVQLAVYIKLLKRKSSRWLLIILFVLGFFQGWLSFDYFFLVSLSSLPFFIIFSNQLNKNKIYRFTIFILPILGFILAHLLHFIQVSAYYKGVIVTFRHFCNVALDNYGLNDDLLSRVILLVRYLDVSSSHNFFALNTTHFLILSILILFIKEGLLKLFYPARSYIVWRSSYQNIKAYLISIIISFAWILVMFNHAMGHQHFLPRHLLFFYYMFFLILIENLEFEERII